jgi:hypothetical protein
VAAAGVDEAVGDGSGDGVALIVSSSPPPHADSVSRSAAAEASARVVGRGTAFSRSAVGADAPVGVHHGVMVLHHTACRGEALAIVVRR